MGTMKGSLLIMVGALWVLTGSIASAETRGGPPGGAPAGSTSIAAGYLHEFGTAVSGGGDFRISRAFINADATGATGSKTVLGLGLTYDREEYTFSGPSDLGPSVPWGSIHRIGFSPTMVHSISPDWRILVIPSMMKILFLLFPLFITGCTGIPENVKPVESFQLEKYPGKWSEIARLDHTFERGLTKISTSYSLREDGGVKVINQGYSANENKWKKVATS